MRCFIQGLFKAIRPQHEAGIRWDDEQVAIKWPIDPGDVVTSDKDLKAPALKDAEVFE